jgi:hypothetical protein
VTARQHKAAIRAIRLRLFIAQGEGIKRAAWKAGVSVRTARRYRRKWAA